MSSKNSKTVVTIERQSMTEALDAVVAVVRENGEVKKCYVLAKVEPWRAERVLKLYVRKFEAAKAAAVLFGLSAGVETFKR